MEDQLGSVLSEYLKNHAGRIIEAKFEEYVNTLNIESIVLSCVTKYFDQLIDTKQIDNIIEHKILELLNSSIEEETIQDNIDNDISKKVEHILESVDFSAQVNASLNNHFAAFRVDPQLIEESVLHNLSSLINERLLASNIQWNNYKLSGSLINGGCIENFSSTGIVDQSNDIELVIRDNEVVVENTATVRSLTVVEDAVVEGTLTVNGTIKGENEFADTIRKTVEEQILQNVSEKIDNLQFDERSELKFGNNVMLTRSTLGASITESNLRSFGIVKELEVSGEASIADTLMVTATGRVGINTMEPDSALTIWDEEVKIIAKKLSKKLAHIGVASQQGLSLGVDDASGILISNNQVQINQMLKLRDRSVDYAKTVPGHSDVVGSIRFNSQPKSGNYVGWVCLGDTRWSGFGKIT